MIDQWHINFDSQRTPRYHLWHAAAKVSLQGPIGEIRLFGDKPNEKVLFHMSSQFGQHIEAMALVRETFPDGKFDEQPTAAFRMTAAEFALVKLAAQ